MTRESDLIRAHAEVLRRNLKRFTKAAWPILEPTTQFIEGWHIDAICEHLQAAYDRHILKLIINVPPGSMKSLLTNVTAPSWDWTRLETREDEGGEDEQISLASRRFMFTSFSQPLSTRDSVKMRRLIESEWYQKRFGNEVKLTSDQNQKLRYDNTATGMRLVVPLGSSTGERVDTLSIDDPNNTTEINSTASLESVIEAYSQALSQRGSNPETYVQIVIMQRLAERDLTGWLLGNDKDWTLLKLPTEFVSHQRCQTVTLPGKADVWTDPRTVDGELLWPAMVNAKAVEDKKRVLGSRGYAAQNQQEPAPMTGAIFKDAHLRFWVPQGMLHIPRYTVRLEDGATFECPQIELPTFFDDSLQSWDFAFKGEADSAYVVGQIWQRLRADRFMTDQIREKADFLRSLEMVRAFTRRHPRVSRKLMEDKANGPAIMNTLKREIAGITQWNPEGDKVSRALAVQPEIEAGNVWLPHPALHPWMNDYLQERRTFPASAYKDQTDTSVQGLMWFARNVPVSYPERSEAISTRRM